MTNEEQQHEDFIKSFSNTRYFQSVEYNKNINNHTNFILTVKDSSGNIKCSGIVLVLENHCEKIFYCPRGPMFKIEDFHFFLQFVEELKKIKAKYNVSKFICNPPFSDRFTHIFNYSNFNIVSNPSITIEPPNSIIIKADNEENMFHTMSKEGQKNVRKAIRNSLTFIENNNFDNFDIQTFYSMYTHISKKHCFTPRPLEHFKSIIQNVSKKNLYYSATYFNSEIISMSIDFLYNGILSCLYSVTNDSHKEKKPNNFMHWGRMQFCAKNPQIKFFECGGVYCDGLDTSHPDYGVYRFKTSLCNGEYEKFVGDIHIPL